MGVGCGDSEEADTGPAQTQRETQAKADAKTESHNAEVAKEYERRQQAGAPSGEEREAGQAAADFYAVLAEDDANPNRTAIDSVAFCELMSKEAQAETVHYARVSSGTARQWDCEAAIELLVVRAKRAGDFKGLQTAEVIAVNAQGDRATASVRFGKGPLTSIPMVLESGEWKLGAAPAISDPP